MRREHSLLCSLHWFPPLTTLLLNLGWQPEYTSPKKCSFDYIRSRYRILDHLQWSIHVSGVCSHIRYSWYSMLSRRLTAVLSTKVSVATPSLIPLSLSDADESSLKWQSLILGGKNMENLHLCLCQTYWISRAAITGIPSLTHHGALAVHCMSPDIPSSLNTASTFRSHWVQPVAYGARACGTMISSILTFSPSWLRILFSKRMQRKIRWITKADPFAMTKKGEGEVEEVQRRNRNSRNMIADRKYKIEMEIEMMK